MSALQLLHESRHAEAAVPVAPLLTDPVEAIQLEAIATELSFFLVEDDAGTAAGRLGRRGAQQGTGASRRSRAARSRPGRARPPRR